MPCPASGSPPAGQKGEVVEAQHGGDENPARTEFGSLLDLVEQRIPPCGGDDVRRAEGRPGGGPVALYSDETDELVELVERAELLKRLEKPAVVPSPPAAFSPPGG